uniref:Ni/Fe hydrogenase subunit alpha n=1 Tax=candidate division WOR-3 bacterium TaxID=2052148 RepID=A0A7C3Z399_UNCW3
MRRITIDPITRLEGHGKIEIFLNEKGEVERTYLQVPELRGFEKFCEGRKAEDMPQLTSRICGVCPVAHHMAATKALDACFSVEVPSLAKKLRELTYCGYIIYDHILHFYFLGGPDLIVGWKAPREKRNILGVIEKAGKEFGLEVIKHRAYGQKITEILGGKATHPVSGIPGGVTKGLSEEEREKIEEMLISCKEFARKTLDLFHNLVLSNPEYVALLQNPNFSLDLYNMGLVDENNQLNFYDGKVRVISPEGKEFAKFSPEDYLNYIEEAVVEWSYVKVPYLKEIGFRGLSSGTDSGLYRVGPLARINVSEGIATPEANQEYEMMLSFYGKKPFTNVFAYHWARLIELLYATERGLELIRDKEITGTNLRNRNLGKPKEGVGIVEAARGTLIHHYKLDENGLVKEVNLIVATTNNKGAINLSVYQGAKEYIREGKFDENILNLVEMFFRSYDPCFACASHSLKGSFLSIAIYDANQNLLFSRP